MIEKVIKRNGDVVPFNAEKLNKWAQYATKTGGDWSYIALTTASRLPDPCTTQEVHNTMIRVCLDKEKLEYSRVASRLELAAIRKNMEYLLSISDKDDFEVIFNTMVDSGVWDEESLPRYNKRWSEWYKGLNTHKFEYWQIKQWSDKYSLKIEDFAVETPAMGVLALYLAVHGDTELAFECAKDVISGKVNLPTPTLNGCRNGDFDTISCCVIKGGDQVDSIGVAEHIAYKMTAKKAGIGITMETRSHGDPVKGGRVKHLGKHGIYSTVCEAVKMFTQVGRGGSATMTYNAHDPQIEEMLLWKTQNVSIEDRIDMIDYSFAYNDAFLQAVINNGVWKLWSIHNAPSWLMDSYCKDSAEGYNRLLDKAVSEGLKVTEIPARDLLKKFLTARQETGRVYAINLTRTNEHSPFKCLIYQSNLCQEIALPTKPYKDMFDLYATDKSEGETAFCSLSALNISKIGLDEYGVVAERALRTIDKLVDLAPMMTPSMEESVRRRRSIGVGITGLANYLYERELDYTEDALEEVSRLSERHYYHLLKASQKLSEESGFKVKGVDLNWLPIDTKINDVALNFDWEALRGVDRKHSVLVAHMPTESSALFSDAINGLYPTRKKVINKSSRVGLVQYIAPEGDYMLAWDVDNVVLSKIYSRVQDFTDQAISADYFVDFTKYPDGKVPMSQLMKEWVAQAKLGNKTMYYVNSNDSNGGSFQDQEKAKSPLADYLVDNGESSLVIEKDVVGCDSGGCSI